MKKTVRLEPDCPDWLWLMIRHPIIPRAVHNSDTYRTSGSNPARNLGVRRARPPCARTPGHSIGTCFPPRYPEEPPSSAPSPPSSSVPRKCAGAGLQQQNIYTLLMLVRRWHPRDTNNIQLKTFKLYDLSVLKVTSPSSALSYFRKINFIQPTESHFNPSNTVVTVCRNTDIKKLSIFPQSIFMCSVWSW